MAETDSALDLVDAVRREATDADGQDPLDEAAALHLKHHGLDGSRWWSGRVDDGGHAVLDVADARSPADPASEEPGEALGAPPAVDGFALRRGAELDLVVRPSARGHGLGAGLARRALAEPGPVSAWSHGNHPAAARLATAHGLERVRDLWVMRRPVGPGAQALPEPRAGAGVHLRPWRDHDPDEVTALLAVNARAFADHPEQGDLDAEGLGQRTAEPWFDPAGLILAVDTTSQALVGFHWTKLHPDGAGEVYVLGVDPDAQGRGLGRTLTLAGLHHLAERGVHEVLLYVESDNTAAVALYAGLGFVHAPADTHVLYQR